MKLQGSYLDNEAEVLSMAGAEQTEIGRVIIKALNRELARLDIHLRDGSLNTERIRDDFRCKFGERLGVGFVGRLICQAKIESGQSPAETAARDNPLK